MFSKINLRFISSIKNTYKNKYLPDLNNSAPRIDTKYCSICGKYVWCNDCRQFISCDKCNINLFYNKCKKLYCNNTCGGTYFEFFPK
jgi:hypothetical protein